MAFINSNDYGPKMKKTRKSPLANVMNLKPTHIFQAKRHLKAAQLEEDMAEGKTEAMKEKMVGASQY